MENSASADVRILGSLHADQGRGVVRLEDRFDATIDELWSALTEPARLARWLGQVDGDLRRGGVLHAQYVASGWEGTVGIEECEPPSRLVLHTSAPGEPEGVVEIRMTADGDRAVLTLEDRGLPLDTIAAYGAGNQIHLEDLAAYVAGRERCDARARFGELHPAYQRLAAELAR